GLDDELSTVSALKIEGHAETFRKYCPDNVYVSMIVAYCTKWTDKLPAHSELEKDESAVQQVVINVSDDNFGDIFPKSMLRSLIGLGTWDGALLRTTMMMTNVLRSREVDLPLESVKPRATAADSSAV
ncbi:hypothetical protein BGZ92_001213, partial [Podila epicladia]